MTTEAPVKRKPGRPRKNPLPEQQVDISAKLVTEPTEATNSEVPASTPAALLKVYIHPSFGEEDKGDGGIRRVVEAQLKHLPKYGIEIVTQPAEADVICYHATVPNNFINLYPRKAFVAMCHGLYWSEYEWGNWSLKANADVIEGIRVSDRVIACSEWVANAVRRHTSRMVDTVHLGVDADEWSPADKNEGYVLWNKTRPDPVCDPTPMELLAEVMPDQSFVSTFGKEAPNVLLTGKLDFARAKELIRRAGVYLCTTRETFGIGTLEAMACGVPIVGFAFGGQAEFIDQEIEGRLVQPGDIDGLKGAVTWAVANRQVLGAAARRKAEAFNWDRACSRYAEIFKEAHTAKTQEGPRTSIVVTNYNLHRYLGECLDSVARQTDQDWECIIVDDHSPTKEGVQVAERYLSDPRFKLVENDKNEYLAEARNVGIRVCRGRYVLPLDADDMLTDSAVGILADSLDSDRRIHVAYGSVRFVEEDGETLSNYGKEYELGHSSWPYEYSFEQHVKGYNLLPYCSMYRKEAWEQTGGYRRRCRTAEDADMWLRFGSYGFLPRMVTKADTLVYRNRLESMSRKEGETDWSRWFSWTKMPAITPAGSCTQSQIPVASLDPIIISVIIPVGPGHEKLVTDAIDSVDSQSFRNWECVVINDTGMPLTTELPSWVRLVETTGKVGPARARNEGIRRARGRLFLPLDADDYLEPDALQMMFDASENGQYIAYCDFWQIDNTGKRRQLHECDDYDPELILGRKREVHGQIVEGMIHSVVALTPKKAWAQVGGYDGNLAAWEDWDFQIAMGNLGICSRRVAMPLFTYRMHKGFRREENYSTFDDSKKGILKKWGSFWEGGKKLAVCGSCSRGRTAVPAAPMLNAMSPPRMLSEDAVLVRYTGKKVGAMMFLGRSKTKYYFGAGDEKYVLPVDLEMFTSHADFEIVRAQVAQARPPEPILVASGPSS